MVKYQRIDVYGCTVVFMGEPTKVEFELMYHDNVERITDDEYKRMYDPDTQEGYWYQMDQEYDEDEYFNNK